MQARAPLLNFDSTDGSWKPAPRHPLQVQWRSTLQGKTIRLSTHAFSGAMLFAGYHYTIKKLDGEFAGCKCR